MVGKYFIALRIPAEDPELIPFLSAAVTETSSLASQKKAPYLRGYTAFMTKYSHKIFFILVLTN